jgi:glycosyltransferase involved in cell wall biosynthesis
MKPFFSIIIPVYNAAATLEACLQSVAEQSLSAYEIILINDGSTDESEALIKSFIKAQPALTINYLRQSNRGLGAARNAGIAAATGQYCAFLDADDIWVSHKLDQCYGYLKESTDCQVLYHPVVAFSEEQERKRNVYAVQNVRELLQKGNPLVPSAVVVRTTLLQKETFTEDREYHGAEDLHLWLRLLHKGVRLHLWPDYLTHYRTGNGMSTNLDDHLKRVFAVLEYFYQADYYELSYLEMAKRRKFYEAGRVLQKRGDHHRANHFYAAADSKSLKILGLRFLNILGFKV